MHNFHILKTLLSDEKGHRQDVAILDRMVRLFVLVGLR